MLNADDSLCTECWVSPQQSCDDEGHLTVAKPRALLQKRAEVALQRALNGLDDTEVATALRMLSKRSTPAQASVRLGSDGGSHSHIVRWQTARFPSDFTSEEERAFHTMLRVFLAVLATREAPAPSPSQYAFAPPPGLQGLQPASSAGGAAFEEGPSSSAAAASSSSSSSCSSRPPPESRPTAASASAMRVVSPGRAAARASAGARVDTIREFNLVNESSSTPGECQDMKREALDRISRSISAHPTQAVRIVKLKCDQDPVWAQNVLMLAQLNVHELSILSPRREHLEVILNMPSLTKLEIHCLDGALHADQRPLAPPSSPINKLKWLRVKGKRSLPRELLVSLLRTHRDSLKVLHLSVGTPARLGNQDAWPTSCADLQYLVLQEVGGLPALAHLNLLRLAVSHIHTMCPRQLAAVKTVMQQRSVRVTCQKCSVKSVRF